EQGRLVCLALHVDEQAWSRVERAFALVKYYCETRRMECELQKIGKENVLGEVLETIARELKRCDLLTLYLTGGPRLLVASAIFSSLLLPPWEGERVTLEVEGRALRRG
ncbi:MAG: hypothetical protein N3F67_06100, partial [Acidilobaceae archaeon]|nr:hypothetical protein [Acidilobaceae archaeon]